MSYCQISLPAIDRYIQKLKSVNLEEAGRRLDQAVRDMRSRIDDFHFKVKFELERTDNAISSTLNACQSKHQYLVDHCPPPTIEVKRQVEVQNEDGTTGTETVTEHKPNPEYARAQKKIAEVAVLVQEAEELYQEFIRHAEEANTWMESAEKIYESAEVFYKALEELERALTTCLTSLSDAAYTAKDHLRDASSPIGPFTGMKQSDGHIDTDGVRRYIDSMRRDAEECRAQLRILVNAAEDANAGWRDVVYRYFHDAVSDDLYNDMCEVLTEMDEMCDALAEMCASLERYASVDAQPRSERVFFVYSIPGIERPGISGSCYLTI